MKIQITQATTKEYPILDLFGSIIINEPTNVRFAINISKELTIEKLLKIANLLATQYNDLCTLLEGNEAIYESVEESITGSQCELITELCYYLELTEEVVLY